MPAGMRACDRTIGRRGIVHVEPTTPAADAGDEILVADRGLVVEGVEDVEEELGRPFKMNDLEVDLSSFAGQIESQDKAVRFYFTKTL